MPYFAAVLEYTDDAARLDEVRPTHRAYLQQQLDAGKLESSGPFVDGTGALLIYEVDDLAEAQMLVANDPFSKAGLITGATVREWKLVFMREHE